MILHIIGFQYYAMEVYVMENTKTMRPTIDYKKTGNRLKFLMNMSELTPKAIQEYVGLSCVQTIYHWISGISIPKIEHLYMLSALFNTELDMMVCGNRAEFIDEKKWAKMKKVMEIVHDEEA